MKMLVTSKLINCGDSFATGYGIKDKSQSYPYLLAKGFDSTIKSYARPGCCNYTIAKQIEYATVDNLKDGETFVLVSTTNEDRISYPTSIDSVMGGITLEDFNYKTHEKDLLTVLPFKSKNKIQSETISNILYAKTRTLEQEHSNRLDALKNYAKFIYDSKIKKDQDVIILLWKLNLLNKKTSNWLCITNYHEIHKHFPNNTLLINIGEICKKYPDNMGSGHFDERGHKLVADKIIQWYIDNVEKPHYDNQQRRTS
jgi:hypothetical protein